MNSGINTDRKTIKTPFLGCAYYPEDWPDDQLAYDVKMMKEARIACARPPRATARS